MWWKFTDVSEVLAASIITLLKEAANVSETSVNLYQTTWRNNAGDSHLHYLVLIKYGKVCSYQN
jgi:hypothetical protein